MTPAEFLNRAKRGDKVRIGEDPDAWEVVTIGRGSFARMLRDGAAHTTLTYLHDGLLRFEKLDGPTASSIEFVS